MVGVFVALGVSWSVTRHLPTMPVVTAILLLIFGSLTFFLQDETFIKMKVTILYTLFGGALLGALWFDRLLLPIVFDIGLPSRRRRLAQAHLALELLLLLSRRPERSRAPRRHD